MKYILLIALSLTLLPLKSLADTTLSCEVKGNDVGATGAESFSETVKVVITESPLKIVVDGTKHTYTVISEVSPSTENTSTDDKYSLAVNKDVDCKKISGGQEKGKQIVNVSINRKTGSLSVTNTFCSISSTFSGTCNKDGNKF